MGGETMVISAGGIGAATSRSASKGAATAAAPGAMQGREPWIELFLFFASFCDFKVQVSNRLPKFFCSVHEEFERVKAGEAKLTD